MAVIRICLFLLSSLLVAREIRATDESENQLQYEIIKPKLMPFNRHTVSRGRAVSSAASRSSSSSPSLASAKCVNVMPGLNRLRRGVDVTRLDLFSMHPISGDDGFRKPIVDFSCSEGKKINVRIPGGGFRTYDLPDEVWDVAALPGGFLSERVEIFKSSRAVQKSMAANAGIDVLGGIFSASGSYEKMSSSLTNESRYLESVDSVVSASRVDLAPFWGFDLSRYAKMFVDQRLPATFDEDPAKYAEFIDYFGTHYFAYGKFGGVIRLLLETKSSYFKGRTESKIKAEAGGMFKNILKAKGGYDGATVTVDNEFKQKTTMTIRYHGGDTNLLDSEGLRKWQPTVAENPWLFGGKLSPLTDLLGDDVGGKKKAMERAVQVHLDKAYLKSTKRLIYAKMASMASDAAAVTKLRQFLTDCDALLAPALPDHRRVKSVCEEIEKQLLIPEWFFNDVKICYRWYPDGDGGQCGGGVSRHLCANVNDFTQYYRDDTDRRGGGCRMSWGIQAASGTTPAWFKNTVQICYRWYPDGDGGQCGGGAARNLCAKVNKYTAYYRDDTDRRGGGCRMSWRLVVGSSAPLWATNLDLCYQWYPDGDGGQCGGGVGRNLCAKANAWTQYYRDDTDRRGGGCRMRWGIKSS